MGGFTATRPTVSAGAGGRAGSAAPQQRDAQSPQLQAILQMLQKMSGGGGGTMTPSTGGKVTPGFYPPGSYTQHYAGSMQNRSNYSAPEEAKESSGDRYANLSSDPFAKGPSGY